MPTQLPYSQGAAGAATAQTAEAALGHLLLDRRSLTRRLPRPVVTVAPRCRLVIIGNGMVSHRLCQSLLRQDPERHAITIFSEESRPAYDRVHLGDMLRGRTADSLLLASHDWYLQHQIGLHLGDPVVGLDLARQVVRSARGVQACYDKLVIATGSAPLMPPVRILDWTRVFVLRTMEDVERVRAAAAGRRQAVVIGGGLLGLETASTLQRGGLQLTVVERSPRLMSAHIDDRSSQVLKERLEAMGIVIRLGSTATTVTQTASHTKQIGLDDGTLVEGDLVVIATGVRPRDNLAAWGLATHPNGGFVVNQFLETSDSHVYAIGECAVVAGIPCGTVSPGYAMAECLTSTLLDRPSAFTPPPSGVRLKIAGLPVAMAGRGPEDGSPPAASASHGGAHRSIHVEDGRIVGATVVGEWREWERVEDAVRRRRPLAAWRIDRFVRGETMWPDELSPRALPGETIVCACNNVTLGAIEAARSAGCRSVAAVAACTHATTTCGACVPMIEGILHPETPLLTSTARRTSLLVIGALSLLVVGTVAGARPLLERLRPEKLALLDHFLRRPWEQQLTGFGLLGLLLMALLMPLRRILWRRAAPGPGWRVVHALVGVLAVAALVTHTGLRLGVNLNRTLSLAFLSLAALGGLAALAMSGRRRPGWSRFLHEALFWPAFALLGLHILVVYYF